MNTLINILTFVGLFDTAILVALLIRAFILWVTGVSPVLYRLGTGLAKRKIAIFAKADNLLSLKNLLLDSKLFKKKNIIEVTKKEDVGMAERATIYVVFWHDWANDIDDVLSQKADGCAMIIYAPRNAGLISEEEMEKIDKKRNTAVTNYRGRLLNDVVTAMITTSQLKSTT